MKEVKKSQKGDSPSDDNKADTKQEHATTPAAKGRKAEDNATSSTSKPNNTSKKPKPMRIFFARIWTFVKAPEHANALVAIFTVVITITGILYTVFAGLQWSVITDQLGVMRKDQRAWLEARGDTGGSEGSKMNGAVTMNIAVEQPVAYPMQFINTGKTPARNIVASIFVDVLDDSKEPHLIDVEELTTHIHNQITAGVVFPTRDFGHQVITLAKDGSPRNATEPEVNALKNGTAYVAIYGIVTYDDVFKIHHWTKFCIWAALKGSPHAVTCTQYNGVDDN